MFYCSVGSLYAFDEEFYTSGYHTGTSPVVKEQFFTGLNILLGIDTNPVISFDHHHYTTSDDIRCKNYIRALCCVATIISA